MGFDDEIDWRLAYVNFYVWNDKQLEYKSINLPLELNQAEFLIEYGLEAKNGFWFIIKNKTRSYPRRWLRKLCYINYSGQIKTYPAPFEDNFWLIATDQEEILVETISETMLLTAFGDGLIKHSIDPKYQVSVAFFSDSGLILHLTDNRLYNYTTKQYLDLKFNIEDIIITSNRAVYISDGMIYIAEFPAFNVIKKLDYPNGLIEKYNDNFVLIMPVKVNYWDLGNTDVNFEVYSLITGQLIASYNFNDLRPFLAIDLLYSGQLVIKQQRELIFIISNTNEHLTYELDRSIFILVSPSEPYLFLYSNKFAHDLKLLGW